MKVRRNNPRVSLGRELFRGAPYSQLVEQTAQQRVGPVRGPTIPVVRSPSIFPMSALGPTGAAPAPGLGNVPTPNSPSSEHLMTPESSNHDHLVASRRVVSVSAAVDLEVVVIQQWMQAEVAVPDVGEHVSLHARGIFDSGADT